MCNYFQIFSIFQTSPVPEKLLNTHINAHVQRCLFLFLSQAPGCPCVSLSGPGGNRGGRKQSAINTMVITTTGFARAHRCLLDSEGRACRKLGCVSLVLGPSGLAVMWAMGTMVPSCPSSKCTARPTPSVLWLSFHAVLPEQPALLALQPLAPGSHRLSLGPVASIPSSASVQPQLRQPVPRPLGLLGPEALGLLFT